MTTSIVSKDSEMTLNEQNMLLNQLSRQQTNTTPLEKENTVMNAYREQMSDNRRYKQFVKDAHEAKQKSRDMVSMLMDHAKKTGDKKAVTTLMNKQ